MSKMLFPDVGLPLPSLSPSVVLAAVAVADVGSEEPVD
jgi:hypothetical protein